MVAEFPHPLDEYIEIGIGTCTEIQNPNSWYRRLFLRVQHIAGIQNKSGYDEKAGNCSSHDFSFSTVESMRSAAVFI
jgi:hypothetical protein